MNLLHYLFSMVRLKAQEDVVQLGNSIAVAEEEAGFKLPVSLTFFDWKVMATVVR